MELVKTKAGTFTCVDGTPLALYLSEDLLPGDDSLKRLSAIATEFPLHGQLIGLPDLHFKVKNFVPSGMTIALDGEFSPKLLGPNNDGMGSLKLRIRGRLQRSHIQKIFETLRARVELFRRDEDVVDEDLAKTILMSGIAEIVEPFGFGKSDLDKFEDRGCTKRFEDCCEIDGAFPKERSPLLPDFVPNHDLLDRAKKCLGTLDGTSHFIELFKVADILHEEYSASLDIDDRDYFFLVHTGAGDIGVISHRAYLNRNGNRYRTTEASGMRAYNAFAAAGNYGFANRLYLYKLIREVVEETLTDLESLEILSDIPHDYLEKNSDGIYIHRKGAVKLLPAHCCSVASGWNKTGMPYLFPSCVGGDAYIISNAKGNRETHFTTSHGAGRLLKKDLAINKFKAIDIVDSMKNEVMLFRYDIDQIEGQNPMAFKDMDRILQMFRDFNLAHPITKLKPLASLKA